MIDPVNIWAFEDAFRRLSTRLFNEQHFDEERKSRHEVYREGLVQIMDGLMREEPLPIYNGFLAIQSALPKPPAPAPLPSGTITAEKSEGPVDASSGE